MSVGSTVVLPINIRALYTHDHTTPLYSLFPGHAPGWWWWYPRLRKRAMEQFKVAVSSWSFFPVINLEATSQLLFKMFHPRAQAPSLLYGDLGPRSSVTIPWPDAQVGAPWLERCNPSQGADTWMPRSLSVIYCTPSTALGEAGCAKVAPSQGALRLKLLLEIWVPPPLLHSLRLWNTGIKAKGLHFQGLGSPFSA